MDSFKDELRSLQDELKALKSRSNEADSPDFSGYTGIIEKALSLTEQAINNKLEKPQWERELAPLMLSLGRANAVFDQRNQQVVLQINIGNLSFTQPIISRPIEPQALLKCEVAFRQRIKERFKEDVSYYIQLSGETTELASVVDDESAPRSARRCRQRISAEYCKWIPGEREIKRVKLNTLREAVDKYPCVILLGDPGCGKTTVLEYLAYELAGDAARLPLPLRLSEFAPGMSVEDLIVDGWAGSEASGHWGAPELADGLTGYLESGKLFCLFDALNEMPQEGFAAHARALRGFIDKWSLKGNQFLVTCRVLDYGEQLSGLQRVEIQPLDDDKVKAFVQMELPKKWEDFWKELTGEKDPERQLMGFARNPYMLTVMIDVFNKDRRLGRNRSELMERFTEILMGRAKKTCLPKKWLDAEIQRESLGVMAFEIQNRVGFGTMVKTAQALSVMPNEVQPDPNWPSRQAPPEKVLNLAASAHIIEMTGDRSSLRFYHQILQEYYAASELLKKDQAAMASYWRWPWLEKEMPKWVRPKGSYDPLPPPPPTGWEETTIMAAGLKPENDNQLVLAVNAVNPVLSGRCLHEAKAEVRPAVRKAVVESLLAAISDPEVALRVRIAAGDVLGYLGDPRIGELVDVPAGKFKMGDNKKEEEKPEHTLFLPDYQIGKYPVTNAEFQEFVDAGGYWEKRWWTDAAMENSQYGSWMIPEYWNDLQFNRPNYPVVGLSWYESFAYCRWKRANTKLLYELPSEAQWEKGARGAGGQMYPWGNNLDPSRSNIHEGDQIVMTATPVGIYNLGISPFGCQDMIGNVWEWTKNLYRRYYGGPIYKYPYRPDDGRENLNGDWETLRVLRGGSWMTAPDPDNGRFYSRIKGFPVSRFNDIGFRVVVSPVSCPSAP